MKFYIAICITLTGFVVTAQTPRTPQSDSAWYAKYFIPKFTKDTGILLPQTKFIDEKGKERTLTDFKGKLLYIGVWATDCGTSVENLVHTGQLTKRLKAAQIDTRIQIVNICFEESKRKWKKTLKVIQPPGINLYCSDPNFEKNWDISGVIKYVLADTSGKVLSFDYLQPTEALLDYTLYAATKGIKPVDAMWVEFRQNQHFLQFRKHTDDTEGQAYAQWYAMVLNEMLDYIHWQVKRRME